MVPFPFFPFPCLVVLARTSTAGAGYCLACSLFTGTISKIPLPKFYSLNKISAVGFWEMLYSTQRTCLDAVTDSEQQAGLCGGWPVSVPPPPPAAVLPSSSDLAVGPRGLPQPLGSPSSHGERKEQVKAHSSPSKAQSVTPQPLHLIAPWPEPSRGQGHVV